MKITRIIFTNVNHQVKDSGGFIATCSVVLDDCMRLSGISLCNKEGEDYYLVFPSKQDVYKDVGRLNDGLEIVYPENERKKTHTDNSKLYEEFYHPVKKEFYNELLAIILEGYSHCIMGNKIIEPCYRP